MIYLDANVFIDFIEGGPDWANPLKAFFDVLSNYKRRAVTSELTLAEVLAPTKLRGALSPHLKRLYLDVIVWNPSISLAPVSREILYDTVELRRFTGHKLPDAIHVATAINARCHFFMSRDTDARKLPQGMELVIPNEDGLRQLIGALDAQ
jgi:predicted nucleic acid-binding protein